MFQTHLRQIQDKERTCNEAFKDCRVGMKNGSIDPHGSSSKAWEVRADRSCALFCKQKVHQVSDLGCDSLNGWTAAWVKNWLCSQDLRTVVKGIWSIEFWMLQEQSSGVCPGTCQLKQLYWWPDGVCSQRVLIRHQLGGKESDNMLKGSVPWGQKHKFNKDKCKVLDLGRNSGIIVE